MPTEQEMPRYRCHKEVRALKIASIEIVQGGAVITPVEEGYEPFQVSVEYREKHDPEGRGAGGYYVVYEDGYESFSPAKAFEAGYSAI